MSALGTFPNTLFFNECIGVEESLISFAMIAILRDIGTSHLHQNYTPPLHLTVLFVCN
jgi:hypothetical protein